MTDTPAQFRTHILDLIQVRVMRRVSHEVMRHASIQIREMIADDMSEMILQMLIPGKTYVTGSTKIPVGWWDHLRHDHPFLQRWFGPPKYTKIDTRLTRVCPHAEVSWHPGGGPHIKYLEAELGDLKKWGDDHVEV